MVKVKAGAIATVTVIIATDVVDTETLIGMLWNRAIATGSTPAKVMLSVARTITRNGRTTIAVVAMGTMVHMVTVTAMGTGRRSARASYADMTKATGAMGIIGGAESSVDDSRSKVDC